ncbi:cryptic protein-like [Stegostoma tigrinum]|uniref:cryptic protein-like n=1 Tax=Stegostoma tigrinum TaxID=3053191 RepID=UPI00202AF324|nr:cryptic protein-like [Stegostoma tigrinum]
MEVMRFSTVNRFFLLLFFPFQAVTFANDCGGDSNCYRQSSESSLERRLRQSPKSLTEFNQLDSKRQEPNSSATVNIVQFVGLTDSKKLNRSCCKNGGTCILGSFCACPVHFVGRYCELDERLKGCGKFRDGQWALKHCTWCRCSYGSLRCIEVFGKVENCDPEQDDGFPAASSSLELTRPLLLSVCLAIVFELIP